MRATATATVGATGVLTVSVSAPAKGYNGVAVSITASWNGGAVGPYMGAIKWGDGSADTPISQPKGTKSQTSSHTYTAVATRTITVTVSDEYTAAEGSGTASIQIAAPLAASLSASPTTGPIPFTTTFTMGASGGYTPYTATLAYGDGVTDTVSPPGTKAHTYDKVGAFTATLTVTDALGAAIVSRSKVMAGVEGVMPWLSALAPLVAGVVLVAIVKR